MIFFLTVRNSCKMLPFDPQEQENNQIAFLIGLLLFFFAALAAIYLVEGSLFNLYSQLLSVFSVRRALGNGVGRSLQNAAAIFHFDRCAIANGGEEP